MFTLSENAKFGSIEINFTEKPGEAVRDALKALRFRWNGARGIWYGYADAETVRAAIQNADDGETVTASATVTNGKTAEKPNRKTAPKIAPLWDRCDVSGLPEYGTKENELRAAVYSEMKKTGDGYDKTVAKYIRSHLRERFPEVKFSVTSGGAGWLDCVNICIISAPFERVLVRGDLNANSDRDRWDHYENSPQLEAVYHYCNVLFNAFDADDGDIYGDYGAHQDLYGDVTISAHYTETEIKTAEQLDDYFSDFFEKKAAAEKAAAEQRAAERAEYEKQLEAERIEREKRDAEIRATTEEIEKTVKIEEIPEQEQRQIYAFGGYGKEANAAELDEAISERKKHGEQPERVKASRRVTFPTLELYEKFTTLFLQDFSFLAGMGGTGTDDARVTDENIRQLNAEQRATVTFYACNCVAVYVGDVLEIVIDPQGFNYSRYVYVPTGEIPPEETETEGKEPFYFPASDAEQFKAADIQNGEKITMLRVDPWMCSAVAQCGTVTRCELSDYAQYRNVVYIEYIPTGKRSTIGRHITSDAIIYRGELPPIPDNLNYTTVSTNGGATLRRVNYAGESSRDYMLNAYKYYKSLGYIPIYDNIQR